MFVCGTRAVVSGKRLQEEKWEKKKVAKEEKKEEEGEEKREEEGGWERKSREKSRIKGRSQ